jgi:hypothetical protein
MNTGISTVMNPADKIQGVQGECMDGAENPAHDHPCDKDTKNPQTGVRHELAVFVKHLALEDKLTDGRAVQRRNRDQVEDQ